MRAKENPEIQPPVCSNLRSHGPLAFCHPLFTFQNIMFILDMTSRGFTYAQWKEQEKICLLFILGSENFLAGVFEDHLRFLGRDHLNGLFGVQLSTFVLLIFRKVSSPVAHYLLSWDSESRLLFWEMISLYLSIYMCVYIYTLKVFKNYYLIPYVFPS